MKQASGALLSAIKLDRNSRRSISVQLYMALRDIILSGGLRTGDRLPATRTLAREAGVSRTTVIDAIDRLAAEGMVVSRVGAGTFVSETLEHQRTPAELHASQPRRDIAPRLSAIVAGESAATQAAHGCHTRRAPSSRRCRRSMHSPWRTGRGCPPATCAATAAP